LKKLLASLAAVGILAASQPLLAQTAAPATAAAPAAASYATTAEAEAMVKKAIAFYKKNGKEKALAEFQKKPGPFVDRDLYVTVYTMEGDALSHINPKMVGKNMMDLRDADGKYHIKERLEAAKAGTSGWQDFKFFNPQTKNIEPKRMYWEKYDNIVFACGAYKPK
jgi:signal transduction histidine kinase